MEGQVAVLAINNILQIRWSGWKLPRVKRFGWKEVGIGIACHAAELREPIANFLGNLVTYKIVSQGHLLTLLAYLNFNDLGNLVVGLSFKILVSSTRLKLGLQTSPWQSRRRSKSLYFVFSPSGQSQEIGYEIKTEPEKKHTVQFLLSFYHKANWMKVIIKRKL